MMALPVRLLKFYVMGLAACLALSACGFHLRGSDGGGSLAQKIYIEGPAANGAFLGVFGTALTDVGGSVVGTPVAASGIVHLYLATYRRQSITLSQAGLSTGYDLSYRIAYDVRTPKGEVLQPRKEFEIKRDYFNNQSLPLAQMSEESLIRQELEKEAAQSLMRRVVHLLKRQHEDSLAPPEKKS